jgi:plasmid stability protein
MKITLDLADDELYRAIKIEAAHRDRSVREIVEEALRDWLDKIDDEEDVPAAVAALADYREHGGIDAAEFFQKLAAKTRARYGPPDE